MSKPIQIQTVQPEQLESLTANMMTTNTNQEITGNKAFTGLVALRACDSKGISHMIYPPYFGDNHQDRIVSEQCIQTLENKRLIDPTIIHRVQGEELQQHTDYTLSVPELTSDATIATTDDITSATSNMATTDTEQTLDNKTINNPTLSFSNEKTELLRDDAGNEITDDSGNEIHYTHTVPGILVKAHQTINGTTEEFSRGYLLPLRYEGTLITDTWLNKGYYSGAHLKRPHLEAPILRDDTTTHSLTVPTLTNDTTIATTDTEQTLTNKTLGEPTLASQTINLNPSNLTNTEISLPAYEGITKYTLLTSQDIENYKTKYVFDDGIYLKAQGFGISHFRMTLHVSNLQDGEAWHNEQITVPYLLAENESSCATGFLLNTAEPYTLILERKSGNNTITITLPSLHHTISNGDYTIDTLLPTPPSGWITGTQPPVNGVSNQGHSLSGGGEGAEEGGIGVSYTGHYLSWDNDGSGSGSIKVK